MTFREFIAKWRAGTLDDDAAWRNYDIPASIKDHKYRERYLEKALKQLKVEYAGEHAMPKLMALYGLVDREEARLMALSWWLWHQIDDGRRTMGLIRRAGGASGDPSATYLAV